LKQLTGVVPRTITIPIAKLLPPGLETIEHGDLSSAAVACLPDKVTSLTLALFTGDISAVPANLRHLTIYLPSESILNVLPSQLETLRIGEIGNRLSCEQLARLPRSLTLFSIWLIKVPFTDDLEAFFKALPPNLTSFSACPNINHPELIPISVPSHSSHLLPRSMTILEIGCLNFSDGDMAAWILGLPPKLRFLKLAVNSLTSGDFSSLHTLSSLNSLMVRVLEPMEQKSWAKCLDVRNLPRSLAQFLLDSLRVYSEPSDITDDWFRGAPPLLDYVTIPYSPLVTQSCLAHLPNVNWFRCGIRGSNPPWLLDEQ
jgi:hypothetical protein